MRERKLLVSIESGGHETDTDTDADAVADTIIDVINSLYAGFGYMTGGNVMIDIKEVAANKIERKIP